MLPDRPYAEAKEHIGKEALPFTSNLPEQRFLAGRRAELSGAGGDG